MTDTSAEIALMVQQRYAAMSASERFMIGAQMFETARTIVLASLPPHLSERERRRQLCERLYGELADQAYGSDKQVV
jgi:hypothetical protein